jgi:putative ABC transport system permease protein
VRLSNALFLWRVRMRARLWQECLAILGIAVGVALLFASQVASSSLQSSVARLTSGIAGDATLQLVARGPQGFPEGTLARVRHIPGVLVAAPLLEASADAVGPTGSEPVQLIGADASLSKLGGELVRHTALAPFRGIPAVVLPAPVSRSIGVGKFGQEVTFELAGHTVQIPLYAQLHASQIGPLIESPIALAPLFAVQEMTDLPARVSRVLVHSSADSEPRVRAALEALAAGRLNVESVDHDNVLFAKAAAASNQSTTLFSAVSALVGFLFAFNATLFTVPQRRRLIVDLRRDGYRPRTVIAVLLVDALALGLAASALGTALGEELSIHVLRSNPAFLSLAFTLGSPRVVDLRTIATAAAGGTLAAVLAVFTPLRDLLSRDPRAAMNTREGFSSAGAGGRWRALAGLACLTVASATLLAAPDAAIPAMVLLVGALLLELPLVLSATLALAGRLARKITSVVPHVATMELSATPARTFAIAATGAIAVFGSVAIQGAHDDLLAGLESATSEANAAAEVWVAPAGSGNLLQTTPFAPVDEAKLGRLTGVRAVRPYRSGLLDFGERRVLVIAPSRQALPMLPTGQLVTGNPQQATERVRAGGWVVLSRTLAEEQHLRVGETFTLPTPDPLRFRVAALSTNLGWAPGAIIMNAADYARAWGSTDISAFDVLLNPGVAPARAVREIRTALGPQSGLAAQSAGQHAAQQDALSRQALATLAQIATLVLIAAVLAMVAAMGAMVWERRPRLAKLKLEGVSRTQLWEMMVLESALVVGAGCLIGVVFGLYGQQLADRALADAINFPVAHSLQALTALRSLALVFAGAVAILSIPGYLAASVPAALALQD